MSTDEIIKIINDSEMVLVGIGEEFEAGMQLLESSAIYTEFKNRLAAEKLDESEFKWLYPALLCATMNEEKTISGLLSAYNKVAEIIKDKNYFVISMNMDPVLEMSDIDSDRTVSPFGSYLRLQCPAGCGDNLYNASEYNDSVMQTFLKRMGLENIKRGKCIICGKNLVSNTVNADKYIEQGYLPQWEKYQKWLMGTVNKKLAILELGVGLSYPSIIRWPFEKTTMYNNKATLIRIGSLFPQLTPEIKERGISVNINPLNFVNEL